MRLSATCCILLACIPLLHALLPSPAVPFGASHAPHPSLLSSRPRITSLSLRLSEANASQPWSPPELRGQRPLGVSDIVDGVSQAGVGDKIGIEKQLPDESSPETFQFRRVSLAQDRMRQDEEDLVSLFSQEKGFVGALVGVGLTALIFVSLYSSGPGGFFGGYSGQTQQGGTRVVERYEEAFVCYGIPTADDPGGCKDKRSVGPVRVFSKEPVESESAGQE